MKLAKIQTLVFSVSAFLFLFANPILAALPEDTDSGTKGVGKINQDKLFLPTDINEIIGKLVQLIYAVAGITFFFMFVFGGIRYIMAGGDEKAATAARSTLTQAVIGLVIVVAAFLITQLLFTLFGIKGFIKLG